MNSLIDRINKVIHTHALEDELCRGGVSLIDFQIYLATTPARYVDLPELYQQAILAGEEELLND